MDYAQKKKLISVLIFNVVFIWTILVLLQTFLVPWYDEMNSTMAKAEWLNRTIDTYKNKWPDVDALKSILSSNKASKWVLDLFSDKKKIESIITKTNTKKSYLDWVSEETLKESDYSKDVEKNDKIIWSIIPVFFEWKKSWDVSNWDLKQLITLDSFINFIETKLLKENNIVSYAPIWIDKIDFWKTEEWADAAWPKKPKQASNEFIWSFSVNLDIEAKDSDILNFINYIQNSWKLKIKDWKLENEVKESWENNVSNLDNLLMTIDEINFVKIPVLAWNDTDKELNKWTIVLRFYVRWISYEQLSIIKSRVTSKFYNLSLKITADSIICDSWETKICKDWNWSQAVANVRLLVKQISMLKKKIEEKTKDNQMSTDVNAQLSDWLSISSAVDNIADSYNKSSKIISEFWKWTK